MERYSFAVLERSYDDSTQEVKKNQVLEKIAY